MGLNDTAEQLEAAQAQSVIDEKTIAVLRRELDRRDYRITELEYALTRAESALTERLQHDAHAHRIIALMQPDDGILLTAEEAALAVRAARHSAESIRAVLEVDPARLHPDVAGYVDRLTDLADHLTRERG